MKTQIKKSKSEYYSIINQTETVTVEVNEEALTGLNIKVECFDGVWRSPEAMKSFLKGVIEAIEEVEKLYTK